MIGQTIVNMKIGRARTRISTFTAGVFLLALVTGLSSLMGQIPMVALAAVMMMVLFARRIAHVVRVERADLGRVHRSGSGFHRDELEGPRDCRHV